MREMREMRKMREKRRMREMRERREMCEVNARDARSARDARDARDAQEARTHRGGFCQSPDGQSCFFQCMIGRAKERNTNKRKRGTMRKVERGVGARCLARGRLERAPRGRSAKQRSSPAFSLLSLRYRFVCRASSADCSKSKGPPIRRKGRVEHKFQLPRCRWSLMTMGQSRGIVCSKRVLCT